MRGLMPAGLAVLLCVAPPGSALAGDAATAGATACPGAAAWAAAHPEESEEAVARRDAARSLTDPQLRAELAQRVAREQKARTAAVARPDNARAWRDVTLADESNFAWLQELVRTRGFPTAAQVGEQGVTHAWLLVHHADRNRDFQAALLPVLRQRAIDGELGLNDFARFTDRVLKGHGRPQYYGTQFSPAAWATPHFGLPDAASMREVEAHRQELGIMPLADYVCMMSEARKPRT